MLTRPLAARVPRGWEAAVVGLVKGVHTAIFASMVGALSMLVWDGLRQQPGRRTLIAGALIVAEAAVYVSNDQVCPLTPLAEEIGAERGSVADIFLPDWMARRIPIIGTTALIAGVALNLRSCGSGPHASTTGRGSSPGPAVGDLPGWTPSSLDA